MRPLPVNVQVGKYRIDCSIGAGGMGEVYRATNVQTGAVVAIKALRISAAEMPTAPLRFRNEAIIQYNLRHPGAAALYEYLEYQGRPCLVMEYVAGPTLFELIQHKNLTIPQALDIFRQVCDAVAYMHDQNVVHRDIKAENIRVTANGRTKLLDFGISIGRDTPQLTRAGHVVGTPGTSAPEQLRGFRGDARADVWALGVLLYELVTFERPFDAPDEVDFARKILAGNYVPASARRPGVPAKLDALIGACLKVKPEARFQNAKQVLAAADRVGPQTGRYAALNLLGLVGGIVTRYRVQIITAATATAIIWALVWLMEGPPNPAAPAADTGAMVVQPAPETSKPAPPANTPPAAPRSNAKVAPARPATVAEPQASEPPSVAGVAPAVPATAETRTVVVATVDGPADVFRGDERIGTTPLTLSGPIGKRFELVLSRPGYQPRPIEVEIGTKPVYSYVLNKD